MCGIAGKIDFVDRVGAGVVEQMCAALEHRGPDSRGMWSDRHAVIGMQRLAIIDVPGGAQPMFNEDRSVVVVMNGEIYNFRELRRQLVQRGHKFSTRSDTEVLVHLYEDYGDRLVEHLRGMFAFAIWDTRHERLLLGRDRVGKKPLFVARSGSKLWFASEIVALLQDPEIDRTPDLGAIRDYLAYQYVPIPRTAFSAIEKLPPASTMIATRDHFSQRKYWQLTYGGSRGHESEDSLQERLRELLWEATKVRLISEVPLGAFLSGGIDSSAVVAAMAEQTAGPVKTFSIGFPDEQFDELRYARLVAEQFATDHHEFIVEPHALEIMPKLARHYGEPFADPSAIPSFYLAELTSRHVTVALNGDGGDESFAGYSRYVSNDRVAHLNWLPGSLRRLGPHVARLLGNPSRYDSLSARAQRVSQILAMEPSERYAHWMSAFQRPMRPDVMQPGFLAATEDRAPEELVREVWRNSGARSRIDRMLDTDIQTYLPGDLLVKMDIATMAYSVEARSPFLDQELMAFAAELPARLKLRGAAGKVLLKSALRGVLPDSILDRPKMGFGVPLYAWFRNELRELPGELLMASDSRVHAYVRPPAIAELIAQHQAGAADHSLRLWVLLQLELWHREVVEAAPAPEHERLAG